MKTDSLFYRLFETSSATFYLLLGMSADLAADTAALSQCFWGPPNESLHLTAAVFCGFVPCHLIG